MTYFLTKGLSSVKMEASLAFLAYNMKRVINILGVKEIMRRLTDKNISANPQLHNYIVLIGNVGNYNTKMWLE